MSAESNGSVSSGDEAEMTGCWSPHHHAPPATSAGEKLALADAPEGTTIGHNIPASKQPWLPLAQPPPSSAASSVFEGLMAKQPEARDGADGGCRAGVFGAGKAKDNEDATQQHVIDTGAVRGSALDSSAPGSKTVGSDSQHSQRSRFSSEGSALEDNSAAAAAAVAAKSVAAAPFRPYAHTFPSAKKQAAGQGNFDPETLAMIREIGSAFVASPTRTEEEESSEDSASLVKHLVKNIEKETKVPKQERKIVIFDSSDSGQAKLGQVKAESSGSSLFTPSPEFTITMAKHFYDSSEQSSLPHAHVSVTSEGQSARSYAESCAGGASLSSTSPRSSSGFGDRSRSEQPPSVVKHLRGRFESHGPHCDGSEGEQSLSGTSDSSATAPLSQSPPAPHHHGGDCGTPVELLRPSSFLGHYHSEALTKSKSFEEQPFSDIPESLPLSTGRDGVAGSAYGLHARPSSQPPRRPRSAEHVPYHYTPGLRQGAYAYAPRPRAPWDREVGAGMEEEGGGPDGVKVRRLHGKSHPLSRLQPQRQGDAPYPPPLQRHSPFHSSM